MALIRGIESLGAPGRVQLAKASPQKAGTVTSRTMAAHDDSAARRAAELKAMPVTKARVARAGITKTATAGGDLPQPPIGVGDATGKNTPASIANDIKRLIQRDPSGALRIQTKGLSSESVLARHAGPQGSQGASMIAMAAAATVLNPTTL
jgi:hypothetical protein